MEFERESLLLWLIICNFSFGGLQITSCILNPNKNAKRKIKLDALFPTSMCVPRISFTWGNKLCERLDICEIMSTTAQMALNLMEI